MLSFEFYFIFSQYEFEYNDICFNNNTKLDINSNECIEFCIDNGYEFEYNNICYYKCQKATLVNNNICLDNKCNEYNPNIKECLGNNTSGLLL